MTDGWRNPKQRGQTPRATEAAYLLRGQRRGQVLSRVGRQLALIVEHQLLLDTDHPLAFHYAEKRRYQRERHAASAQKTKIAQLAPGLLGLSSPAELDAASRVIGMLVTDAFIAPARENA